MHTRDDMHMEAREKLREPVLSFHRVNHSDKTQVFRFGGTAFYHGAVSPVLYHFVFFMPACSEQIFKLVKKGLMRWKRAKRGYYGGGERVQSILYMYENVTVKLHIMYN